MVNWSLGEEGELLLSNVRILMSKYGESYWNQIDWRREFPEDFINDFFKAELGGILVPKEYGGPGMGAREASAILYEVNRLGGNSYFLHGQYYVTYALSRCVGGDRRDICLREVVRGRRAMTLALTEPQAGSDTTKISTFARKVNGKFIVNGRKVFISRLSHTDYLLLAVRTSPYDPARRTYGITLFLVDAKSPGIERKEIRTMSNTDAHEVNFNNLELSMDDVIGEVDKGFGCLLAALNAERTMIAAELLGNARWFLDRAVKYASERKVFDRPIGANQGVQFPLASGYAKLLAAEALLGETLEQLEGERAGEYSNSLKYISAELSWDLANVAMDVYGGYGYASDTGVERKFRETRLYMVAPVSQNLALSYLAVHSLGLPRSY